MFVQEQPVVYQSFPDAVVTRDDGEVADIEAILPTKVLTLIYSQQEKENISDTITNLAPAHPPPLFKKDFQAYIRIKL
jgi:hypothetical protein